MPTVTGIIPNSATVDGGERVTIDGTLFTAGATVTFGGTPGTSMAFVSANRITVVVPARVNTGPVVVQVRNAHGAPATFVGFHYRCVVSRITPAEGPSSGGTDVVITGKGFHAQMEVEFGGVLATHVVVASATELRARTPAHAAGSGVANADFWNHGRAAKTRVGFRYCAPLVTGATPNSARPGGAEDIVLRGRFFDPAATVSFGGTASPLVNFRSSTELVARTPAHAVGATNVVVTNPDGVSGTLTQGLTFIGAEVKSIQPARGPAAGGTDVTIRGVRFAAGATVSIGGTNVVPVIQPPDSLTARTPAHAAGAVDIVVQNGGEAASTLVGAFTYIAAPAVTRVEPPRGTTAGGTAVTVTGTDFAEGARVLIGGRPATQVTVVSPTTLTATTPAHAAGTVDIEVQNADGAPTTLVGAFTYTQVTSIAPARGLPAGGTDVVIRGHGFAGGATVSIGGTAATHVNRVSDTELRARTAAHVAGLVDVVVTNPHTPAMTLANGFTYATVTSILPAEGPVAGNTVVVIRGDAFANTTTVAFGGTPAAAVAFQSAQELHATTAAGIAGPVDVVVTRAVGGAEQVAHGFSFRAAPTIASVAPPAGPAAGGTSITLTGTGFVDGATVTLNGVNATHVRVLSPTTLTATTAAQLHGTVDVTVTVPGVPIGTLVNGFTYRQLPTLAAITPAQGALEGGRAVNITGARFLDGIQVRIGGVDCTDVVVVNAGLLQARVPAHVAGACDVQVQNPGEPLSLPLANAFTYVDVPTETGDNAVQFLMDGEEYFEAFRVQLEAVRQAPRHANTYVRLAFWMIEASVTVGDRTHFKVPNHTLLSYIDRIIRAGHDFDIIVWRPAKVERVSEGKGVAEVNEAFAQAVAEVDRAAAAAGPGVGRVRVFLETYEGEIGASNHQKVAIFSVAGQRTVLLGGINLSPSYFAPADHSHGMTWHDAAIQLRGPATDDVEAEWMRRWRRTSQIEDRWIWNSFGGGGDILARGFAFNASQTVRREAIRIQENRTLQAPQGANINVSIALTRSEGTTRYRKLRDLLLARIAAADQYIYLENYHFADPEIVRAIYTRHEVRRQAGQELRVIVMMPLGGGATGYMTRRSWLQLVLRFRRPDGTHYCSRVYYMVNGVEQHIDRANCVTWTVVDTYQADNPTASSWLEGDTLTFRRNGGGGIDTVVKLEDISRVDSALHIYTCMNVTARARIYTHSKVAIIDNRWLIVGSANWSYRSMQYDGEISAFIDNPALAQNTLQRLLGHYDTATPLTVNNIEAEACTNLAGVLGTNLVRQAAINNQYVVLPLGHTTQPGFGLPRVKPGMMEAPNYTWY